MVSQRKGFQRKSCLWMAHGQSCGGECRWFARPQPSWTTTVGGLWISFDTCWRIICFFGFCFFAHLLLNSLTSSDPQSDTLFWHSFWCCIPYGYFNWSPTWHPSVTSSDPQSDTFLMQCPLLFWKLVLAGNHWSGYKHPFRKKVVIL